MKMTFTAAKSNFFDASKVQRALDAATRRNLMRFGAFVRQRVRSSIRKRKAISEPGSMPSGHIGRYRQLIFFAYEPAGKSVVIGPVLYRAGSMMPLLLEYGGVTTRRGRDGIRTLHYRARPHMRPAFQEELKRLPELWRNSVKAT